MNNGFVYCWTDHETNKLYVGSHKGNPNDGYICSSKHFMEQYKERPTDFTRQIIAEGNIDDIRALEVSILQSMNARKDPMFYNKTNGDKNWFPKGMTKETKQKISKTRKEKKVSSGKNNPMFGRKHNEETKQKLREKAKQQTPTWLGKKFSDEHRKQMSESRKGKNNPNWKGGKYVAG